MPRRSSVIFWLLLAATLCVDLAAIAWTKDDLLNNRATVLYFGLAFGQLSALTVWSILRPTKVGVRWLMPFVTAVVFAVVWAAMWQASHVPHHHEILFIFIGLLSLHVIGAMTLVWVTKSTRWFARWTMADPSRRWQFGIGHLLVLMTCLAVFLVVLGRAMPGLRDEDVKNIPTMIIGNMLLLLAVLVSVERLTFWLFSVAASLGAALAIAAVCNYFSTAFADVLSLYPLNLIQAMVLWCWIAVLRPAREQTTSFAESPKPTAP